MASEGERQISWHRRFLGPIDANATTVARLQHLLDERKPLAFVAFVRWTHYFYVFRWVEVLNGLEGRNPDQLVADALDMHEGESSWTYDAATKAFYRPGGQSNGRPKPHTMRVARIEGNVLVAVAEGRQPGIDPAPSVGFQPVPETRAPEEEPRSGSIGRGEFPLGGGGTTFDRVERAKPPSPPPVARSGDAHAKAVTRVRRPRDATVRAGKKLSRVKRSVGKRAKKAAKKVFKKGSGSFSRTARAAAPKTGRKLPPQASFAADEGTQARRYPAISPKGKAAPGREFVIEVDLRRERQPETETGGVSLTNLSAGWKRLPIQVKLLSPHLEFARGKSSGVVTIRRNEDSIPATFAAKVSAELGKVEVIEIVALFSYRGRHVGFGRRDVPVAGAVRPARKAAPARAPMVVDVKAERPVLTVRIFHLKSTPIGHQLWSLDVSEPFDEIPPNLDGEIDLESAAPTFAGSLFKRIAALTPQNHVDELRGIGRDIYGLTPPIFKELYWMLRDRHGANFPIQFVSDDAYVPWELMRPSRGDEQADLLMIDHPVARWIEGYRLWMTNQIPRGRVVTIAPEYSSKRNQLPEAQTEAQRLVSEFNALRIEPATREVVKRLMRSGRTGEDIAVVHFAGHGKFTTAQASASSIDLEDGAISSSAVAALPIGLAAKGRRPLVLFNACETGNTGAVLGQLGGWAETFVAARCSGFIAPLWRVYDDEAIGVTTDLLDRIVRKGERVGPALREIRVQNRKRSPTYFAYLYYGDVMAGVTKT